VESGEKTIGAGSPSGSANKWVHVPIDAPPNILGDTLDDRVEYLDR